jgi:hypothetical protein
MMLEELHIVSEHKSPFIGAAVTYLAFVSFGSVSQHTHTLTRNADA